MEESQLEEYSYRAKQKIRRYFNAKEKKRFIVNFIIRLPLSARATSKTSNC